MLWLALHLPLLSLEAFCATLSPELRQRPVVLLADHRVQAANAAAAERGIRAGIKRATALALAGDLLVAESSPARDAAALLAVAHAALAFTPSVTLQDGQNTVLLEVQGSLRLFGGLAALRERLTAALAPLQQPVPHVVHMAAAPTALGAALLARWHPPPTNNQSDDLSNGLVLGPHATRLPVLQALLDDAPVWLLGPGREHWEALQGMGLHHLSDLRQLPRGGLARRFGAGLLDDLDRAFGHQADPRCWLELPAEFESRLELYAQAENTEQVLHAAAVLLARLVAWAQARRARVGAFTLRMRHEPRRQTTGLTDNVRSTDLHIALAEPALDAAHLQLLLRERLARVTLAAPTLELRLHCKHLVAGPAPNGELFPTRASQTEGLVRLLERLRARLGDTQVQRLVPVADHRPEHASRTLPAKDAMIATLAWDGGEPLLPLHRPAWLLPDPLPLAERGALPLLEGQPLQLLSGPERIESGWWDGHAVARDYFIAQAVDGSLVWLYRGRMPAEASEPGWFLQGRFA